MKRLGRHCMVIDNANQALWAMGLHAPGPIRSVRLVNTDATMIGWRRFGRVGAICNLNENPWPDRLELEVTCDQTSDQRLRVDQIGFEHLDPTTVVPTFPWNRLRVVEQWLNQQAPNVSLRHDAEFFYRLEQQFNRWFLCDTYVQGHCGDSMNRMRAVDELVAVLMHRLSLRQSGHPVHRSPGSQNPQSLIDDALDRIFSQRFGGFAGTRRMEAAIRTFAQFGSGALHVNIAGARPRDGLLERATNGAPNGPLVFAFAEYALSRIASRPEYPTLWRDMLPGCLLAAELYLMAFHRLDRTGHVCRQAFSGDVGGPAPLLRCLSSESSGKLIQLYLSHSMDDRSFFEAHLGHLLQTALEPISGDGVRRSQPLASASAPPQVRGVDAVVFPSLPRVDVPPQPWWTGSVAV